MTLAGVSEKCKARCLQYVDSQINLIDNKVRQAIARKSVADKQTTKEFRSFKDAYLKFRPQLVAGKQGSQPFSPEFEKKNLVNDMENYLGA